jgi:hypothetical protein
MPNFMKDIDDMLNRVAKDAAEKEAMEKGQEKI